jgi:anhydro-N-acetylmuramic acid kinase
MKVIGLMSGTSADGIDAALLEIGPGKALPRLGLLQFLVLPFPRGLRERILRVADDCRGGAGEICHLNADLGERFAVAARTVARRACGQITVTHGPDLPVRHGTDH